MTSPLLIDLRALSRDPWIIAALLFAFSFELLVLGASDGARIGDTVEHLERATDLARGIPLGSDATRGALLSVMLAALRCALDVVGFTGALALRIPVLAAALGASAAMIVASAGSAAALAGRSAARVCAWMLATTPVVWIWSGEATAAPFAACALAISACLLVAGTRAREYAAAGVLGGLSIALKYQLVFLAPLLLILPSAKLEAGSGRRLIAGSLIFLTAVACSSIADAIAYGSPWLTAPAYLRANVLPPVYALWHPLLPEGARLALHSLLFDVEAGPAIVEGLPLARRKPFFWYATQIAAWWPLPWIALALVGSFYTRSKLVVDRVQHSTPLQRAMWSLAFVIVLHLFALALKGEKELRLLYPLMPCIAVWMSVPVAALTNPPHRAWHRALFCVGVLSAIAWPLLAFVERLPAGEFDALERHASYRDAMRAIAERAPQAPAPSWSATAVFHFAIALEGTQQLRVAKAPYPLEYASRARGADRLALEAFFGAHDAAGPTWLLGHAQSFRDQQELLLLADQHFEIAGLFFDPQRRSDLDELWVLARRGVTKDAWPLSRRHAAAAREQVIASLESPIELLFLDHQLRHCVELMGVELHPRFLRDGCALMRWVWRARRDLLVSELPRFSRRVTLADAARQIDGPLGGQLFAGEAWPAGEIREESVLIPLRGLDEQPGEAAACSIWIAVFEADGAQHSPQDRGRFPRSADDFVRVGGGISTERKDGSMPPRHGDSAGF